MGDAIVRLAIEIEIKNQNLVDIQCMVEKTMSLGWLVKEKVELLLAYNEG